MGSMFFIKYDTACRDCYSSTGISTSTIIQGEDEQAWMNSTEFSKMKEIELWRRGDEASCEFCGSQNVEVTNIKVGDYALYDFNRVVQKAQSGFDVDLIVLSLDKTSNIITKTVGGRENHKLGFYIATLEALLNEVNSFDDAFFNVKSESYFYCCIVEDKGVPRIERMICHGFGRDEIVKEITPLLKSAEDLKYPALPNLSFPYVSQRDYDRIYEEIFSNIGRHISMEISYFDENVNDINEMMKGNSSKSPTFKKVSLSGTIEKNRNGEVIVEDGSNNTVFIGFNGTLNVPFILGSKTKGEMQVSEIDYKIY